MRHSIEGAGVLTSVAGYEKYHYMFNMDETSIYIDMNPSTTITFHGERNVDVVQSKSHLYLAFIMRLTNRFVNAVGMSTNSFRASVFLCASAAGGKLPPLIVFAGVQDGDVHDELRGYPAYPHGAILTVQQKAYCDERVMKQWIDEVRCTPGISVWFIHF